MQWEKVHHWMEKNLQEPFTRAELARAEMGNKKVSVLGICSIVAGVIFLSFLVH